MKKIINGRKYDTETARKIGDWNNGKLYDFDYVIERLYKKKTGEYFLYGEGGAVSKYGVEVRDGMSDGSDIIPLTEKKALIWAEEHLDADEYEEAFGEVEE